MPTYTVEWDKDGDGGFSEDISGYVMDVHTDRGRKTDLETMPPGYATLILNNADGRFSPDKAAGPYFGDIEIYRRVRIKATQGIWNYGLYFGFILGWDNKPKTTEQTVTWFLGDRFALMQDVALKLLLLQRLPVKCALDLALNRAAGNNECTNSSVETDLADYSGLQGVTPTRDGTMKIEGDYSVFCNCPGDNAGEGWQYDATGQVTHSKPIIARVWARASETVTLKFQVRDSVGGVLASTTASVGTTPTLLSLSTANTFSEGSDHYFDLVTNGASEVMFWSDGLFFITPANRNMLFTALLDDGTAEIELAASYRQPALETVQAIAESEPRSFFFIYASNAAAPLECLRFRDKDWRATAIAAGPVATFSDDGSDIPYHDLVLGEDAIDRISEVEVVSQGTYLDENEEVTVWELSPIDQPVAATETIKFRARYSQPARDCSLVVNPPPTSFGIGANGEDGHIYRAETGDPPPYPPVDEFYNEDEIKVGQEYHEGIGWQQYSIFRGFLMWDTSGIPDEATINSAKLRLWLKVDRSDLNFTIQARASTWTTPLSSGDWDGTGVIKGTISTAGLPHCFDIELNVDTINKTGWTKLEMTSSREGTAPTAFEFVTLYDYSDDAGRRPTLLIEYGGTGFATEVFKNYGVGADIELTAGANPVVISGIEVKGKPLKGTSEESKVIAAAPSPPPVDRTLSVALPLQGSRTSSMEAEATRLAARYDGRIRRPALTLRPVTDAVLTQMLVRQIGDLIHVENIGSAYGTWIDGNYWIEGIEHSFEEDGSSHETTFYLEEV